MYWRCSIILNATNDNGNFTHPGMGLGAGLGYLARLFMGYVSCCIPPALPPPRPTAHIYPGSFSCPFLNRSCSHMALQTPNMPGVEGIVEGAAMGTAPGRVPTARMAVACGQTHTDPPHLLAERARPCLPDPPAVRVARVHWFCSLPLLGMRVDFDLLSCAAICMMAWGFSPCNTPTLRLWGNEATITTAPQPRNYVHRTSATSGHRMHTA